jgi:hypothetical protein
MWPFKKRCKDFAPVDITYVYSDGRRATFNNVVYHSVGPFGEEILRTKDGQSGYIPLCWTHREIIPSSSSHPQESEPQTD